MKTDKSKSINKLYRSEIIQIFKDNGGVCLYEDICNGIKNRLQIDEELLEIDSFRKIPIYKTEINKILRILSSQGIIENKLGRIWILKNKSIDIFEGFKNQDNQIEKDVELQKISLTIKEELKQIKLFIEQKLVINPNPHIVFFWIWLCYRLQLFYEVVLLFKRLNEDEIEKEFYNNARKLAQICELQIMDS